MAKDDEKRKGSGDKPEWFTFVMECKAPGVYQTFQQDAETREEARPKLQQKARDAGWDLGDCSIIN